MRLALQSDTVLAMQLESNGTTPDGDLANQTLNDIDSKIGIRDSFDPHISTLQTLPVDDDINDSTLTNGLNGGEEIYVDEDEIVDEDDEEEDEPIDRQSDTDSCSPQDLTIQADVSSPSGNNHSESSSSLEYRMYNPIVTSENAYTVSINYPRGDEDGGGGQLKFPVS